MPRPKSNTLTDVELEFMQVVWDRGEVTSRDVRRALASEGRERTGGSVRKMLSILVEKGYLTRRRDGRAFLYSAAVPKEEAHRSLLRDLLRRAFDGSAALLVAALLDTRGIEEAELDEIKRLISERKGKLRE